MAKKHSDPLMQRWLHSHEEDTRTDKVYRPASFPFPPSRGRTGFELRPDHSYIRSGIAARDGVSEEQGTWEIKENGEKQIILKSPSGDQLMLRVVSVDHDRLVVRK
jgi:hypothetical protein